MGWLRIGRVGAAIAVVAMLCVACDDSSATDSLPTDTPTPSTITGGLPLVRGGAVLHAGDYCHFDQVATPGDNALPVPNGCMFSLTTPIDLFATDGGHYSVSEVVGDAELGVRGAADAKVMIVCRLSPRTEYWFWISADAHWNISQADDVHHPRDLVSAQDAEPLRQYLKVGGVLNSVQFKCAGGQASHQIMLALNVNDRQFTALTVPMPSDTPLTSPATPWFVDLGARLTSAGTLDGTVAKVTLYDGE